MMLKELIRNKGHFFLSIILIFFLFYLIFPNILFNYFVPPIIKNNLLHLFGDWTVIIAAIKCKSLGYDVFVNNPCDMLGRRHVYGSVLLYIPFFEEYKNFYIYYFPLIINLIFILIVCLHFNFKNLKEFLFCFVFIFNPSTLLAIERLNFDIFIFLSMVFLCYFRKNIYNLILITFLTISKFYPLSIVPLFFLVEKKEKLLIKFIYFIAFLVLASTLLYLDIENIIKIFNNAKQFTANYRFSFSFFALSKIPLIENIFSKNLVIIFSIILSFIFIIFGFYSSKKIKLEKNFLLERSLNYRELLFLISCGTLVSTYFVFNNIFYREIFLFGLVPLALELEKQKLFFKNFINLVSFLYIFFSLSAYLSIFKKNDFLLIFYDLYSICFFSFICGMIIFLYIELFKNSLFFKKFSS